jgi:hypothetical protein
LFEVKLTPQEPEERVDALGVIRMAIAEGKHSYDFE